MTTTDAPEKVLSLPLPHGTRVRSTGGSSIAEVGELGTVVGNDHADADSDWSNESHKGGLFVKWDDHDKVNYIAGKGYTASVLGQYAEVVSPPETETPLYVGVSHKHTPEAKGIIVSRYGDDYDNVIVMRTGQHLGLGTQDWDTAWVMDEDPPVYETDYGLFNLGQRVIFTAPYAGMRGTVVGHQDGDTFFFVDPGQGFDTQSAWSDPDNTEQDEMFCPSSCGWHRIGENVGIDKVGNPLHIGDRVIYDNGYSGEFDGVTGTILRKGSAGALVALVLDSAKQDGSPLSDEVKEYTGPNASMCELGPDRMTRLKDQPSPTVAEKIDTGMKSKFGLPIYVGDKLEYIPGASNWKGTVLEALDQNVENKKFKMVEVPASLSGSYAVGAYVNLTAGDLAHVVDPAEVPDALGPKFRYADNVLIAKGDKVVRDPGQPLTGRSGTVLGLGLGATDYVLIELHDGEQVEWAVGTFSRLQDEDKEKIADEMPQPVEALQRVEQLFEKLDSLKDDLEGQIDSIGNELSATEQRDVEVEFDSDDVSYDIEVSTDPSRLIGYFSVSDGEVEVNDGGVDDYIREIASVTIQGGDSSVNLESYMTDLHAAFAEGRDKFGEYLETLDEVRAVVSQVLSIPGIEEAAQSVIVSPEAQTFEGTIRNARFGVVMPEDGDTGASLRFDVVDTAYDEGVKDTETKATRRVRLTGPQIGRFLETVNVSDVKDLEDRKAIVQETPYGGWFPTAVSEV